jgi:hypothetical protein
MSLIAAQASRSRISGPWIARIDRVLGGTTILFTLALLVLWLVGWSDPTERHAGLYSLFFALLIGPSGALFLLAGHAMDRQWRARWVLQILPFLALFMVPVALPALLRWL